MKLSIREKACFGLGAFGKDIFSVVVMSYIMIFYTDVFGLSASLAGLVLLITRLVDALSNPVLGAIMDRTTSRWGRFRPYLLIVPVPFAIFTVLMFWYPELSPMMKFIYALITFNIAGLCFTCIDVAIWGLMPNLTRDGQERSQLISLSRAFSNVAGMVFAPLVIPLVLLLGQGEEASGYAYLGIIVGSLSILFCWILFFNSREIPAEIRPRNTQFFALLKGLLRNRAVLCVILAMTTFGMSVGLQNAMGIYYLKYYLYLPEMVPVYILISYSFKVLGALIAPRVVIWFGNASCARMTFLIMGFISSVMLFSPVNYPLAYFALAAGFSIGIGILLVSITGMMAEASDKIEQASGQRNDGMLFSFNALSMQTGFALSAAIAGFILELSGYVPNQVQQSATTLNAINAIRCLGPAFFCFLVLIAFRLWSSPRPSHNKKTDLSSPCRTKNGVSHD